MTRFRAGRRERGAAAIEFAMVFSLLFGLFWAMVSYAFPLFLLQVMNRATAEAARVAIKADPSVSGYSTTVNTLAGNELTRQLSWLPTSFSSPLTRTISIDGANILTVRLAYLNYKSHPIVPALNFPGIGQIPNMPTDLVAQSSIQL